MSFAPHEGEDDPDWFELPLRTQTLIVRLRDIVPHDTLAAIARNIEGLTVEDFFAEKQK